MKIWIIDHYSVPVKYYPLARNTNFAKYLMRMGHDVTIFAASTVHNSTKNLIEGKEKYIDIVEDGVRYVLVKCHDYSGNGIKRMSNMVEFGMKLQGVCSNFPKPDAVISTSMTLFACREGLKYARKNGCKAIAQITDLWPETIVAYGVAGARNPAVVYLRLIEKWIYTHADDIVFSMEGAYDYIVERGWQDKVPASKVHHINNGVDLEVFNYNRDHFRIDDEDLDNPDIFKVIYTGSIRRVNNLGLLLDAAKKVQNPKVRFLIWGDGDELPMLKKRLVDEGISNVVFKGRVDKKYVPYIVSKADANMMHGDSGPLFRFGISPNKMFDYFAAGKPVLMSIPSSYNPVVDYDCGFVTDEKKDISSIVDRMSLLDADEYRRYCDNSTKASRVYSFEEMTKHLLSIIQGE